MDSAGVTRGGLWLRYAATALASLASLASLALLGGCGSSALTPSSVDAGSLPVIATPPLACATHDGACACSPEDAGAADEGASLTACDESTFAKAHCCAGPDFPFAGGCTCSVHACADGGAAVPSCSDPPAVIPAAACDPAECNGSSCAGGYCCTSSCQAGACVSTCGM